MSEPKRYALAIVNNKDGPLCKVGALRSIEVVGATPADSIAIEHEGLWNGGVQCSSYIGLPHGPGMHELIVPAGTVRVRRVSGDSKISVFGWG